MATALAVLQLGIKDGLTMKTNKDLFLILASLTDVFPSKVLIKKLFNSFDNFLELFTDDLNNFEQKLNKEEIHKIQDLKKSIELFDLQKVKKELEENKTGFIAFSDPEYPIKLKNIDDPPFGLFYRGNLNVLNGSKSVAVVGTRGASNYGMTMAKRISSLLSESGVTIISGLAAGIDSSAHRGALEKGKTIAVLGTGLDVVFPASNKDLFYEILETENVIVSEYPIGIQGVPWNFPQRNRIISALSDAVLVIEGDLQSGALITARFAIKQNKLLFALPGPIDSPTSNGPNILIKSGVAELLASVNDILEKFGESKQIKFKLETNNGRLEELTEKQKNIYNFLSSNPKGFDSLLAETNTDVQELTRELSMLELKQFVEKTSDGGYVKVG